MNRSILIPLSLALMLIVGLAPSAGADGLIKGTSDTPDAPRQPVPSRPLWQILGTEAAAPGINVQLGGTREPDVAVDPNDPQRVAYASLTELRVSTDGGATWQPSLAGSGTPVPLDINTDEDGDGLDGEDPIEAGVDNDADGAVDEDPIDGVDNDGDGFVDEDPGVNIDNDNDGMMNEDPCWEGGAGDPSLAYDGQGRLFWTFLYRIRVRFDSDGNGTLDMNANWGIDVAIARVNPTTGAIMAGYPVNITSSAGVNLPGCAGNSHDKEWIAADWYPGSPNPDRLYVAWMDLTTATSRVISSYSDDQGMTWSAPFTHSAPAEDFVWPCHLTVAPNSDVYVAYHSQPSSNLGAPDGSSGEIFVRRSMDGGVTFPQKTSAFAAGDADMTWNVQVSPNTIPNTTFWLQGSVQPWIMADPNVPGRIYVVANDDPDDNPAPGTDAADVFIAISNNYGVNWSSPRRVDKGPGQTFQVMPTADIDPETGCIAVMYFDNRNGATNGNGNFLLDQFMTVSTDGGLTFGPEFQVNDLPFDPDQSAGAGCRFNCTPLTDNDGDGLVDEDPIDGINNDGDGRTDEDPVDVPTGRIGEYIGLAISGCNIYSVAVGNTFDNFNNPVAHQTIFDNTCNFLDLDPIVTQFDPPNPWTQEGIVVEMLAITSSMDLDNVRLAADPLQAPEVPCEENHHKKIGSSNIELVPREITHIDAGDTAFVEVKITVPIGQHTGTYKGQIHVYAQTEALCVTDLSAAVDVTLNVLPTLDVDIDDNQGNLSDNTMYLKGAKGDFVQGHFVIVNPNSWDQNVDFADGPGNVKAVNVDSYLVTLQKVGDDAVFIPNDSVHVGDLPDLSSGEAAEVSVQIFIPDGIPVNAFYRGRLVVEYEDCFGFSNEIESFEIELHVLPTQGSLDIVQTEISGDYCPPDPWTMVGQVALSFDVHAVGDHRNIRVASGGLKHESIATKLDDFNFYPEEIAFLAAGETRTINIITKIPIGQNSGSYSDYFRVVSENGGEDSVMATIDICDLYDMDIKDDYGNVSGNVMQVQAYSRANQSGGEWALRAFDMGLPSELIGNHDEYDGPGNSPVDCITCTFAPWSPMWHEADPSHNLYSNFAFTGVGEVLGDSCGWESGEFRRMLVGLYVPPMLGGDNHPGTYKGRLDCYAVANDDTVSSDSFDIEVHLARVVGKPLPDPPEANFVAIPTSEGAALYWGDFRPVGISGSVNVYRLDGSTGAYDRLNPTPLPQRSQYLDRDMEPGQVMTYRLGVWRGDEEVYLGPVSVGGNPRAFKLAQNAPNPFGDRTTIAYELPKDGKVSLRVFDLNGRLVRVLKDVNEPAGFYTVTWDRRDDAGRETVSGIYFYRLDTPGFSATKKMIVLK